MKSVNRIYANTVNTIRNCHRQPSRGMQSRVTILALCTALLLPGIAMAKKPQPTPGCVILMDKDILAGNSYAVKVVRDPSYPGAWHNPTFTIEASYPGSMQTDFAAIQPSLANVFDVTYVKAMLTVPIDAAGGTATISVTVEEPLNKRKVETTTCSTTVNVQ